MTNSGQDITTWAKVVKQSERHAYHLGNRLCGVVGPGSVQIRVGDYSAGKQDGAATVFYGTGGPDS